MAPSVMRTPWCCSYLSFRPRRIETVSSTVGSDTNTGWKRRASAASFSTCFLYSSSVVAPMQCSSPRASAGLSRLEASIAPSALPAPTSVCISSMNRMMPPSDEVTSSDGGIILFIDEMHTLVGAGKADGAMDASNLLKPALARGELHCIGATTLDEHKKHVEKDAALARRFQPVFVSEPNVEDTISILRGLKDKYEQHHGVRINDAAIVAAATLSNRYITDRFLPDKAIDLVDEAAARL